MVAAFDPRLNGMADARHCTLFNMAKSKAAYNGVYLEDGNLSDNLLSTATNPADVVKLWKLSEKLVGQEFAY